MEVTTSKYLSTSIAVGLAMPINQPSEPPWQGEQHPEDDPE